MLKEKEKNAQVLDNLKSIQYSTTCYSTNLPKTLCILSNANSEPNKKQTVMLRNETCIDKT